MLKAMHYRGPDGLHHLCTGAAALGQARFHVIHESKRISLPYSVPEKQLYLAFDGRLDNAPELADALQLRRNKTDVELLAAAYFRWGDDCAAHLDGDFAFALWDASRNQLLCARDHTGTRPFYYHHGKTFFAFASELPPLLALAEAELELNQDMVTQFLAQSWVSNEDTFWRNFKRLPPAHTLAVKQGNVQLRRYWQPDFQRVLHYAHRDQYREHYLELITDIVRRQTRSDYPVAFEVSGGLDSSALFSVASDLHQRGRLEAPDVAGYTLDFLGCGDADEVAYAEAVGQHCGREIVLVPPTYKPLAWYRNRGQTRGEYCNVPNGVMAQGLFEQAAAQGSRVLLNGTGGDDWLDAGDRAYAESFALGQFLTLLEMLRNHASWYGWKHALSVAVRDIISGNLTPLMKHHLHQTTPKPFAKPHHLSHLQLCQAKRLKRELAETASILSLRHPLQFALWQKVNGSYALLAHEAMEATAAEAGLKIARPYWSKRLVEFTISLPRGALSVPGDNRTLHRRAMHEHLPKVVLERYGKAEFSFVYRQLLPDLVSAISTGDVFVAQQWCAEGRLEKLLADVLRGKDGGAVWSLWMVLSCSAAMARSQLDLA